MFIKTCYLKDLTIFHKARICHLRLIFNILNIGQNAVFEL